MVPELASAGYSGRPLPEKLGMKPGITAAFVALPESLKSLKTAVDFEEVVSLPDWKTMPRSQAGFDFIHAFVSRASELAGLETLQAALKRDGMIWISWPKKAAKVATDLTEDLVREAALALDLVDVKVAAIDEKWSGLKLMIRKDRR